MTMSGTPMYRNHLSRHWPVSGIQIQVSSCCKLATSASSTVTVTRRAPPARVTQATVRVLYYLEVVADRPPGNFLLRLGIAATYWL
eukprot:3068290-Rhodomonas_salina.2